jgi:two-component system NtrC family sensor kinase
MSTTEQSWLFYGQDVNLAARVARVAVSHGARSLWVVQPEKALDAMLVERPSLVVLEESSPHGGDELLGLILAAEQFEVPAIVVTEGHGPRQFKWTSRRIGAEVVIRRPLDDDELLRHVEAQLHSSREVVDTGTDHWSQLQPLSSPTTRIQPQESALLERAERMATRAVLADGVMHKLAGLFFLLPGHLELLEADLECLLAGGDPRGEVALARLRGIRGHLERASGFLKDWQCPPLLSSASTTVDLIEVVQEALSLLRPELERRARVTGTLEGQVWVVGNRERLRELVVNLAVNCIQALADGSAEHPVVDISCTIDGDDGLLTVTDNGPGIPAALESRVFTPFFTTKPDGAGTGLGLSICRAIAREHRGTLELDSAYTDGARFTMRFPRSTTKPARCPGGNGDEQVPRERARVLVVDDESAIRRSMGYILRGHQIVEADSVAAAIEEIEHDGAFDLILCDVMMPGRLGTVLHNWLEEQCPRLLTRLVYMTGGVHDPSAKNYLESHNLKVIEKPFDTRMLRTLLEQMLDAGC